MARYIRLALTEQDKKHIIAIQSDQVIYKMKSSQLLQSIVVLVVVSLTSAEGLSLSLSYPDSSNPSIIRFTCKNGEDRALTATFQKNGEEITDQVSVIINSAGILEFAQTSRNGLGGTFTCTDNGVTSNSITLPGELGDSQD